MKQVAAINHIRPQTNLPAIGRELNGIGKQVIKNLLNLSLISHYGFNTGSDLRFRAYTAFKSFPLDESQTVMKNVLDGKFGKLKFLFSGFDLGQIQNIVDESE